MARSRGLENAQETVQKPRELLRRRLRQVKGMRKSPLVAVSLPLVYKLYTYFEYLLYTLE